MFTNVVKEGVSSSEKQSSIPKENKTKIRFCGGTVSHKAKYFIDRNGKRHYKSQYGSGNAKWKCQDDFIGRHAYFTECHNEKMKVSAGR